jgi:hypothetical protein
MAQVWVDQVWYFRATSACQRGLEFIAALSRMLVIRNYVRDERLPIGQLYILRRGLCVKMWRFLGARKVGTTTRLAAREDARGAEACKSYDRPTVVALMPAVPRLPPYHPPTILLTSPLHPLDATSQVWGEDIILDNEELIDHSQAVALTYVEAYTLRRLSLDSLLAEFPEPRRIVEAAKRRVRLQRALLKYLTQAMGKPGPMSFTMKSMSHGAETVEEKYGLEQKVVMTASALDDLRDEMHERQAKMEGDLEQVKQMRSLLVEHAGLKPA